MDYAIIDIESTGGSAKRDKITEIAIYRFNGQRVVDSYSTLLNPEVPIPPFIRKLTGIDNDMVANKPTFGEAAARIFEVTKDAVFVAHNVQFDYSYIRAEFKRLGQNFHRKKLCTLQLSRNILPNIESYSLGNLCDELGIEIKNRHRAAGDAQATVELFKILLKEDHQQHINRAMQHLIAAKHLPPRLSSAVVENVPEDTGVYYFHDASGEVIYIGKNTDMQQRVIQHFTNIAPGSKNWKMIQSVADISFHETGSELIAMLMEVYEIARLKPRYNKTKYTLKPNFGIYKHYDPKGYLCLKVQKVGSEGKYPILAFEKKESAARNIWRKIEKFNLCPLLCGMGQVKGATCSNYQNRLCRGACIGKEKVNSYNRRVHRAIEIHKYPHPSFLIIGEGKSMGEHSVVRVEQNQFTGYGYFDSNFIQNIDVLKDTVKTMYSIPESNKIIRKYLNSNKIDKVIPF